MRNELLIMALAVAMASCSSRRQTTVVETAPATTVYTPSTSYTTVTRTPLSTGRRVRVTALNDDVSQNLDLNAVAALFGQSSSLEAFEQALNKEDGICNLDLNGDGYVDYIRVVEVEEDGTHLVVLQAVLAQDIFQDIATIVAEKPAVKQTVETVSYVQIVGDPYIYGRRYVLEPVYVRRPLIFDLFWPVHPVVVYRPYRSPYYWGYMPTYYRPLPPRPMRTYVQQINVFITNNNYCNHSNYVDNVRYSNYGRLQGTVARNDYGTQHPERSFDQRTSTSGVNAENARAINESNRTIINRTLNKVDKVQMSSGTRQQGVSSGTRQQGVSSGTRQQSVSSGTRQTTTPTSGTRQQGVSSGTRQTTTPTSGTRQQSVSSGTRQTTTPTSGTRQQSVSSGTRQTTAPTSGTRQQSVSSGTRQTTTPTSGTRQQSVSSGTRQQTTSTTTGSRSGNTGRR